MQTRNPFVDEMTKAAESVMGLAQAAGAEARTAMRAQADRLVVELDLVRRDELDALRLEVAALRDAVARLSAPAAAPAASSSHGLG